jgi:glycerol kinase
MQCLADTLNAPVDRPRILETTALGAAYLAGMQAGIYPGLDELARNWHLERRFLPAMDEKMRRQKLAGWADAVSRTLTKR